jgi:ATP-dependent Clp protease adaptor protein ClpS
VRRHPARRDDAPTWANAAFQFTQSAPRLLCKPFAHSAHGDQYERGERISDVRTRAIDFITRLARPFLSGPRAGKEPRKNGSDDGPGFGAALITRTRPQTRRPNMYRVLLLNDDYTTQEFVVIVLQKYFNKSFEDANRIMLHVHKHGVGECGVYTYEVAETKVTQVMEFARKHQHPLQCIMEKK